MSEQNKSIKTKSLKKWYAGMLFLVVLIFGSVIGFNVVLKKIISNALANRPEPEYPVTVEKITPKSWRPSISSIGYIKPSQGVLLKNEQGGIVDKINFISGQEVLKNSLIMELNTDVEEGQLSSAQAQLIQVESRLKRVKELYQSHSVSLQDLDIAESNYKKTKGEIQSLKGLIERRKIRAPFDGKIGIKNIYKGQFLAPGSNVVRLENTEVMQIEFSVSQNDYFKIKKGFKVKIHTDAYPSNVFYGLIKAIEPAVDNKSGVFKVLASIPNNNGKLISGMFAQVKIQLPLLKDCIVIPQEAISFELYGQSVYIVKTVTDDTKTYKIAKKTLIKTTDYYDNFVLVSEGLNFNDEIVTTGQIRLNNKSHVKIVQHKKLQKPIKIPEL